MYMNHQRLPREFFSGGEGVEVINRRPMGDKVLSKFDRTFSLGLSSLLCYALKQLEERGLSDSFLVDRPEGYVHPRIELEIKRKGIAVDYVLCLLLHAGEDVPIQERIKVIYMVIRDPYPHVPGRKYKLVAVSKVFELLQQGLLDSMRSPNFWATTWDQQIKI
jgi:hypothetical protein